MKRLLAPLFADVSLSSDTLWTIVAILIIIALILWIISWLTGRTWWHR